MTQIHVFQNSQSKEQSENQKLGDSPDEILHHLKLTNVNSLAVGHLNMNSLRNKFDTLKLLVENSLDIFMISEINETSPDETFPGGPFLMDGFKSPYWTDRNANGGDKALYVREDIPSGEISLKNDDKDIESFLIKSTFTRKNR